MTKPVDTAASMPRAWYREPLVWMVIAIPLCAVVVGMVMLRLAWISDDGLVADDYYKKGMEINRTLERDETARAYGLQSEIVFSDDLGNIAVTLTAGEEFDHPPQLTLNVYHATRAEYDRVVQLTRTGTKTYHGVSTELVPGRWYLDLSHGDWRLTGAITWPVESVTLAPQ